MEALFLSVNTNVTKVKSASVNVGLGLGLSVGLCSGPHVHRTREMSQAYLDSVASSIDGPAIEAWPAKSDDGTNEGLPPLVGVDSHLGFTVGIFTKT